MSRRRFILRLFFAQCCHKGQVMWGEMAWEMVKGRATQVTLGVTSDVHMSFTDFVVFPPRHGRSVTDF